MNKKPTETQSTARLLSIDNLSGRIFPVRVGGKFAYDETWQTIVAGHGTDEHISKSACEVSKQFAANSFHAKLDGAAYLVICDSQNAYRKNPGNNHKARLGYIFFEALGYWIMTDPVSPREKLVSEHSNYTLKSFSLAR